MKAIGEIVIFDITFWNIIAFSGVIVVSILLGRVVRAVLRRVARRKVVENMEVTAASITAVAKSVTFIFITIGFMSGIQFLRANEELFKVLTTASDVLLILAIGFVLYRLIEVPAVWFEVRMERSERQMNKMFLPVIKRTLRVVLVILVLVQIVQIFIDKPITSIVAGLGIGGLAVALAAQDTLRHFFGSVALVGDKPFDIGDRIVIDGFDGPVEAVDLRSTRIRTLEGHLVTIPNGELANKTIHNIGKRPHIRRLANITVTYDTSPEKVKEAKAILEDILKDHEGMDPEFPPRVYFSDFNAESLNILVLYWYHPPDYWAYMDFSEKVNLEILKRFNEAGIEFAFPTQTVYYKKTEEDQKVPPSEES